MEIGKSMERLSGITERELNLRRALKAYRLALRYADHSREEDIGPKLERRLVRLEDMF